MTREQAINRIYTAGEELQSLGFKQVASACTLRYVLGDHDVEKLADELERFVMFAKEEMPDPGLGRGVE